MPSTRAGLGQLLGETVQTRFAALSFVARSEAEGIAELLRWATIAGLAALLGGFAAIVLTAVWLPAEARVPVLSALTLLLVALAVFASMRMRTIQARQQRWRRDVQSTLRDDFAALATILHRGRSGEEGRR